MKTKAYGLIVAMFAAMGFSAQASEIKGKDLLKSKTDVKTKSFKESTMAPQDVSGSGK